VIKPDTAAAMYVYVCVYCIYLGSWYTQELNKMAHASDSKRGAGMLNKQFINKPR